MSGVDALKGLLPTDSLYKFGVIAGIALALAGITREIAVGQKTFEKVVEALSRVDELSFPAGPQFSSLTEVAGFLRQTEASTPEGRSALMEAAMYVGYLRSNRNVSRICSLLGGGIIGVSLAGWYYGHQRHQDKLSHLAAVRAELELKKLMAEGGSGSHE